MKSKCVRLTALLCAGVVLIAGCENKVRRFAKPKPPDFRRMAALPGLAKSADPHLVDELARLTAEEATPQQLAAREPAIDVAAIMALRDDFPQQRIQGLLSDIAKIYPRGRIELSSAEEQRARDLLRHETALIERTIALTDIPERWAIDHGQGLLADLHFFDLVELAHRARALQGYVALVDGDLRAASDAAAWLLAIDHRLASLPTLVPRLKGARLRLEALRLVEVVTQDQRASHETQVRFRQILEQQLAAWPHDSLAWIGDRAQGLHTYEMIRHGMVLSVLSDDEMREISGGAGISATAKAIAKDVDRDEAFYLAKMRAIIARCDEPYFVRRRMLEDLRDELQAARNDKGFPVVAGRVLLTDLDAGHRLQAKDLAACEGWRIALAAATGAPTPHLSINPETGLAYTLEREATRVVVRQARAGEPDEAIVVPILPPPTAVGGPLNPTTSRAR